MVKLQHEVRDACHGFIIFDNLEKKLIDSQPVQRLRQIHQLAMCYQVYPGATHKRFEHSLGVMDLAGRIFDTLFREDRLRPDVRERIAGELESSTKAYWRKVTRIAGLLHDAGHLPFSHAAEHLLPEGWNHERLTGEIIRHSEIAGILSGERPAIDPEDVIDVAMDATKRVGRPLTPWKGLLNVIICGNTFGADRMDYLLRDSHHAGVPYGRFDVSRLIDGLKLVIDPASDEVTIGLEHNTIHAAESLLLARYFMYTQVYFHDVRRAYDVHLTDFLKGWLDGGAFPSEWSEAIKFSDNEVLMAAWQALRDPASPLHTQARRLLGREHFRTVYELNAADAKFAPDILAKIVTALENEIGGDYVRCQKYGPKSEANVFPVAYDDGVVVQSTQDSDVIKNIPPLHYGLVFVCRDHVKMGETIVARIKDEIRMPKKKAKKGRK